MKVRRFFPPCIVALALVLWVPVVFGSGAPEVSWPDTPAGRWVEDFFRAFNTNGPEALRDFVLNHYSEGYLEENPTDQEIAQIDQLRGVTGALTVHSVRADGDFAAEVITRSEVAGWVKFRFGLAPESPHDLAEMEVTPTSPPGTGSSESEESYEGWQGLGDLLQRVRQDAGVPAMAAAIVHEGKILDKAVVGVRRCDQSDPVRMSDGFQLGSVTKLMAAVMIERLVETGALSWDTTIGEILKDEPMLDEYRGVTLEQLLLFRGGLQNLPSGGVFAEGVFDIRYHPKTSPEKGRTIHVRQVLSEPPVGDPDEAHYSSSAYVVAGRMAERVTGRPWEELMRRYVFEPLGMESAGFGWPATAANPDQPHGHYGGPPELNVQEVDEDPIGLHTYMGLAGDVYCSIEDLARYAAFHLEALRGRDGLVTAETVQRFWGSEKTKDGKEWLCAFGTGGTFVAMMVLYPETDVGIVALTNCGHHAMPYLKKLRDALHKRMAG